MSGHESTYEPKTGIEKWIDARLPIVRLIHGSFVDFPVAKNLNYWWTFGAILAVCLMTQIITGVFLAMFYKPDVNEAFNSVERIMRDVEYGWLIRYIHANGASMFFLAVYIHMFRGLYYGSYKAPREISWILGVVIYLLMMGTAFLGYVLPWGQMSYHGSSVITSLIGAIPLVGETIKTTLQGGPSIGEATLNRFFSLHYLLPFIIAGVVVLHIWAFHTTGNNNPTGVDVKTKKDVVPFHPYYTVKDGFAIIVFLLIFAGFVFYAPNVLGHADNYIKADPLKTPAHIVPEWYLLPFYAMLRAITFDIGPITAKLGGVIVMFGSIAILFVLPWLDTSKVRSLRYRPLARQFFFAFVAVALGLGVAGASNPDDVLIPTGESKLQYETKVSAIDSNLEGEQLAAVKAEIVAAARQAELDRQAALEAAAGGDDTTEEATEEPAASEEPVGSESDTASVADPETPATADTDTAEASVPEAPAVTEEVEATPEEDTVSEEEPVYVIFRDEFSAAAKATDSNVSFKKDSTEVFKSETAGDVKLTVYSAKVQNAEYEQIMELGETYQLGDRPAVTHPGIKWLIVTQLLTLCYFAYFLIILPLLGLIEKPKDEPESIAKAVNKRKSTGTTGSDATVAAE